MTGTVQDQERSLGRDRVADRIPVIDTDVHQTLSPGDPALMEHVSTRWRDWLATYGLRHTATERGIPPQREFTHRLDAIDPSGRPAVLPDFTRGQLLDEYDMTAVVLGNAAAITFSKGGGNFPEQLAFELTRAFNDAHREVWLKADPRFYVAIHVPIEHPHEAAAEIRRCKEGEYGDRYASIVIDPRAEYAVGSPKYWPVYEVCEHYGIPVTFHTAPGRRMTPSGTINYYFEWHCGFPIRNYSLVSSMIFEGVFERFPGLKVGLIEQSWAWAVPFTWRLDAAWKMLRSEVPHLSRPPSESFREHFWFSTQPMEEPERLEDFSVVLDQFEECFSPHRLMFSSDYPHWDFDSPYESVPRTLPDEQRRRILGQNASLLYGIPLRDGTGIVTDVPAGAA